MITPYTHVAGRLAEERTRDVLRKGEHARLMRTARPYRSGRPVEPIRLLLANGIPVIANQLLESGSTVGHYRVVKGYDDASATLFTDDPLQRKGSDFRLG